MNDPMAYTDPTGFERCDGYVPGCMDSPELGGSFGFAALGVATRAIRDFIRGGGDAGGGSGSSSTPPPQ